MFDEKKYQKEYGKQYYLKNKEKILARQKQKYENNKEVFIERSKNYIARNIDKVRDRRKKYRAGVSLEQKEKWNVMRENYVINNPEKRIISLVKSRAKKFNLDFNLEVSDIHIPKKCPVLDIEINKENVRGGKKGPKAASPSVDRIDNNKGYVKGNIQIISFKANAMKSNATPEELLKFAFWVILTYGHLMDKENS